MAFHDATPLERNVAFVFGEKLGVSSEFSYKTIERGYEPERSKKLLDEVMKIMNETGNPLENTFSTDGTGDPYPNP